VSEVEVATLIGQPMPGQASGRILVTGASGQIGSELVAALRLSNGIDSVLASDIRETALLSEGPFVTLDVLDRAALEAVVESHEISVIYHLAAILSAAGEKNPALCQRVNIGGLVNVLEVARSHNLRVFSPSSIAVFGPDCPDLAEQDQPLNPLTMYGVTKVTGELLASYYFEVHGVDVRGVRYPGLISWKAAPGGGTTDYAVDIFHAALELGAYSCFVSADTCLPMMYMDDAIRATLELMDAPVESLSRWRGGYNVAGISFSAGELAAAIAQRIEEFVCDFEPDVRQEYADTWPDAVDDSMARAEWGWQPRFDLDRIVDEMLANLRVTLTNTMSE
jgi:nucleoside-diphosphate-sugar epimerase